MSRSIWKGYFLNLEYYKKHELTKKIFIWSKNTTITGDLINKIVFVYNGKSFRKLFITASMVGFKFGEFIFTRT